MGQLAAFATTAKVEKEGDTIRSGSYLLESGAHDMTIDTAWLRKTKNGATILNMIFTGENNKKLNYNTCIVSGDAKGNKITYIDKQSGNERYLPGYALMNSMSLLAIDKELIAVDDVKKTIKVYDYTLRKDIPTEVDMLMELIGNKVKIGVFKQIVFKQVRNETTSNYDDTADTKEINEIDKFFRPRDSLTTTEILAGATEATFFDTWAKKYTGITQDKTKTFKGVAPNTSAGAMQAGANKPAPSNMFT